MDDATVFLHAADLSALGIPTDPDFKAVADYLSKPDASPEV